MIKVSVIVPVYNSEVYLRKCVDSLVNQTLNDIEILFINDGSTDNSLIILKEYEKKFPEKVTVITKDNGGQAAARNIGIDRAIGEYIGFVDSDDYISEEMFQKMYDIASREDADLVECDYKYLKVDTYGNNVQIPSYGNVREYGKKTDMFIDPLVSPWNKLYKASVLKNHEIFFPEGLIYEDTSFFIKAIPYVEKTAFINQKYIYHFFRENSTMNSGKEKRVGNIFLVLQDIINEYIAKGFFDKYHQYLELFIVKILLCSSLQRIAHIRDSRLRKQYCHETMCMIKKHFPKYRSNPLIKSNSKGLYMRLINPITIRPIIFLLGKK